MWVQTYDPLGWWPGSTLAAALPVAVLLGTLATGRVRAWVAAVSALALALLVALTIFKMPWQAAWGGVGVGLVFALSRIVWLIVAAVFLYNVVVETGSFAVMRASIAGLSQDRRIQAVLIAYAFGAFIEGIAGFGAPVAISAAFLVGLGFPPLQAAILCLVANTAPVAWGSLGIPIQTLGQVTKLNVESLSATAGRILPPISLIVPFWLVAMMSPWRRLGEVAPAILVLGGTFAVVQGLWANFVGVDLVDLAASSCSLAVGAIFLRFWQPRHVYRFEHDLDSDTQATGFVGGPRGRLHAASVRRAWTPFVILAALVLIWGLEEPKRWMNAVSTVSVPMPGLHLAIAKGPELTGREQVDPERDALEGLVVLPTLAATGTAVFLAAILSGLYLGVAPARLAFLLGRTLWSLRAAAAAILAMLALGHLTRFSGMDAVLGLALTRSGPWIYPILGTFLGWLGVALTGSDTASNILFGNLQVVTADKLGLNPILMASANSTGGVMGKMVDAQSIVVAAAATGIHGKEGPILRAVFPHSLALAGLVALVVWVYAHVAPNAIPLP